MKITAIKAQKRGTDRVNLYVDGEFRLAIASEILLRSRIATGDEVTEESLAALQRQDLAWKAKESAIVLLSYRPRSEKELRDRLRRKEFPEEIIEGCLQELDRLKLLDDRTFAEMYTRDRLRQTPKGRSGLIADLRKKGIDREQAESAVEDCLEQAEMSEVDLAREASKKFRWKSGEETFKAKRRMYAFLGRRGFSSDAIRSVLDETF